MNKARSSRRKSPIAVEQLLQELPQQLLRTNARKMAAWKKPRAALARLLRQDYVRKLRNNLSLAEVRLLLTEFQKIFPRFNASSVAMMTTRDFSAIAGKLNFHLQATPYRGREGFALRGFYVTRAQGVLQRPLVFVNTAHHPLAVGTSFMHELAHHFTSETLNLAPEPIHFFFDADYEAHLKDPSELAADVMVSLAGYSAEAARRIFSSTWAWGLVARTKDLSEGTFNQVREHLRRVYGFDLMERIPPERRLNYLAGMIHYAKLRWALMIEYDL